ncbi:nitrate reductase associated protein, partial [Vacuolonema iberomarrocanum]|uniref:nitrate reductase associated protein n=1 Tax=Vacuolonema iberomarrocanum TaxID=3454632 RepID=UPI0019DB7EB0|nr:nitrate reductase associated protein [filamentous cyanobacterium LEGE 07170]
APPWADSTQIPPTVQAKLEEVGSTLSLDQWQALNPIQRFALIKLSRPSHENRNFVPALREFGLS